MRLRSRARGGNELYAPRGSDTPTPYSPRSNATSIAKHGLIGSNRLVETGLTGFRIRFDFNRRLQLARGISDFDEHIPASMQFSRILFCSPVAVTQFCLSCGVLFRPRSLNILDNGDKWRSGCSGCSSAHRVTVMPSRLPTPRIVFRQPMRVMPCCYITSEFVMFQHEFVISTRITIHSYDRPIAKLIRDIMTI